jgi:hypothetical protein
MTADKRYVHCPECGNEVSAHGLLCRACYKQAGGVGATIYREAAERGEASPRSRHTPEWHIKRALKSVNIVSLITCNVTGLSYVGVTKNGRLDDPSNFSPLRYGFGRRFVEAMRRYGPYAFTVQILGHGYATRKELCLAQRQFIKQHNTLWPNGYNVRRSSNPNAAHGAPFAAIAQRLAQDPEWRAALTAAATERKQSSGWRVALKKRSENTVWRHNISAARMPYLHARWHVKKGLVPADTAVENCDLCKAVVQRKERREQPGAKTQSLHSRWHVKRGLVPEGTTVENCEFCKARAEGREPPRKHREPLKLTNLNLPNYTLEEQLDDMVQRVNAAFKRA